MPELDLGPLDRLELSNPAPSFDLALAAHRLATYMAWPREENRRREYLATLGAQTLQAFQNFETSPAVDVPPEGFHEAKTQTFHEVFLRHGGYGAVSEAPGMPQLAKLMRESLRRGYVAGTVLRLIMTVREHHSDVGGGASLNKAIYLIERQSEGLQRKNRKDLIAAWSALKPVAHLCAAFIYLSERAFHTDGTIPYSYFFGEGIGRLLAIAREFQEFATTFKAHGQKQPILEPSEIFTVPRALKLPAAVIDLNPLSPEQLAALRDYRAPVPSQ